MVVLNRYKPIGMEAERYFLELVRYRHLNRVRTHVTLPSCLIDDRRGSSGLARGAAYLWCRHAGHSG